MLQLLHYRGEFELPLSRGITFLHLHLSILFLYKRILTKEKLDRQLTGQTSATPFTSIRDGHQRRESSDTKEELGDKIDKIAVMIGN